jgi:Protein of unknown function (DUF3892)
MDDALFGCHTLELVMSFNALNAGLFGSLSAAGLGRQVTEIRKPNRYSPVEAIEALRGPGWSKTREEVYWDLKAGITYYTLVFGVRAELVPRETIFGTRYVQTRADSLLIDNLLSLPEF